MKRDEQPATPATLERLAGLLRQATQYRIGLAMGRVEAAARRKAADGEDYPHAQVAAARTMYCSRDAQALRNCCEGFARAVCKLIEDSPEFPVPPVRHLVSLPQISDNESWR